MRTRGRFILLFLIAACPAAAQTVPSNAQTPEEAAMVALRNDVEAVAAQIIMARAADRTDVDGRLNLNRYGNLLGSALVRARGIQLHGDLSNLMLAAEQSRTDEQIGSGSGASGTTSLTSKGSVPAILGLAVENGALTQTTSGTTITFTGSPVGIVQALEDKGFVSTAGTSDPVLKKLSRVSFSVAFDAGRGATTPTFTGDKQQLSQYSFRAELVNHRDPRRSALWRSIPSLTTLASEQGTWIRTAQASAAFKAWFDPLQSAVDTLTTAPLIRDAILEAIERFPFSSMDAPTMNALGAFGAAVRGFEQQRTEFLDRVKKGLLVTLEYVNNLPVDAASTSTLTFIAERGASGADFTVNASTKLVNGTLSRATPDRLREAQVAVQLDAPLLRRVDTGTFLFSLSGEYQYLRRDPAVGLVAATTASGSIAVAQMKLTIPLGTSGAKIPLSVSFANRTELINEHDVRGNVGLTYDLDALFVRRP